MAQSGGLEGFIKDLGAEGAAMLCATGRFIAFPICFLLGNFWGKAGSLRILLYLSGDQNLPPSRHTLPRWDKSALSGCKLGSGPCVDAVAGRIC